jgi:hypothetical protein
MFAHYVHSQLDLTGEKLRAAVMAHLMEAFVGGFMVPGDLDGDRFRPWNVTSIEALARIERDWPHHQEFSFQTLQDVCWLVNTPTGNRAALLWSGHGLLRRLRPRTRPRPFAGAVSTEPPAV